MDERTFLENIGRLDETGDAIERNGLAMDLAATRDPRVFDVLVRLIKRPELENQRGTLMYCLEGYDCSSLVDLLLDLAGTGNAEVSMQSRIILRDQKLRRLRPKR